MLQSPTWTVHTSPASHRPAHAWSLPVPLETQMDLFVGLASPYDYLNVEELLETLERFTGIEPVQLLSFLSTFASSWSALDKSEGVDVRV